MKAAFLFRFASFVQWPADVPANGHFVIGAIDGGPVTDQLERLQSGMSVRGQPVEVRRISKPADLDGVHILYIGPGPATRTRTVRGRAATLPVLLVTDQDDSFGKGGVINFVAAPRNVRFEISLVAAERARLTIDSALLAVAARVERRAREQRSCERCELHVEVMP